MQDKMWEGMKVLGASFLYDFLLRATPWQKGNDKERVVSHSLCGLYANHVVNDPRAVLDWIPSLSHYFFYDYAMRWAHARHLDEGVSGYVTRYGVYNASSWVGELLKRWEKTLVYKSFPTLREKLDELTVQNAHKTIIADHMLYGTGT